MLLDTSRIWAACTAAWEGLLQFCFHPAKAVVHEGSPVMPWRLQAWTMRLTGMCTGGKLTMWSRIASFTRLPAHSCR